MVSGTQSSAEDHHSSSSSGAPRVATKNRYRSSPTAATGPACTPSPLMRASAARPAAAGMSNTSKTRPVGRMMLASGCFAHQRASVSGSAVALRCHTCDQGCAAGDGQPIRSHEQARVPSLAGCAPGKHGQPRAAYSSTAAAVLVPRAARATRPRARRRRFADTSSTVLPLHRSFDHRASPFRALREPPEKRPRCDGVVADGSVRRFSRGGCGRPRWPSRSARCRRRRGGWTAASP